MPLHHECTSPQEGRGHPSVPQPVLSSGSADPNSVGCPEHSTDTIPLQLTTKRHFAVLNVHSSAPFLLKGVGGEKHYRIEMGTLTG